MNSIFDTSNDDAAPAAPAKKMEGFGGGAGFQAGADEFRNAPAGGGAVGGAGGTGNFDARAQQGGVMGMAFGAAAKAKNAAAQFAESNEYAAKALQMGGQVVVAGRDCHFADVPSPSLLKHLLKGEGGAVE